MRRLYIHEQPGWPQLCWQADSLADALAVVRYKQGLLVGRMESLGFDLRQEAVLETLTQDVHKTSDIEGEKLDLEQIRSSIGRRLGMDIGGLHHTEERVDGVVEMTLDATGNHHLPLTRERLYGWHSALFPAGRSRMRRITVGGWRDDRTGPMQVISGPIGEERVHFEAPAAQRIDNEMEAFLEWFNGPSGTDGVLRAGLAHLWFVIIHPFDDGNGRIARAIADMSLARSEGSSQRFYSMSSQIRAERRSYYNILERTQKGPTDISGWMKWFLECLGRAIDQAQITLAAVLTRARFWERIEGIPLNPRQRKVLIRLLDGFEGKLTTSKWAKLAKCSQDTALRDITGLVNHGILARSSAGGRSTSYRLEF
ncbi:MAG: Fic family protein [bacterium]|nr:Fic family protein [bacterium]